MVTTAELTEQVPIEVPPNAQNVRYLRTKRAKLGQKLQPRDLRFETDEQ
jgi:GTP cyclohydrolase II